jgi:tetratricopeptide (TPR) repeat protein
MPKHTIANIYNDFQSKYEDNPQFVIDFFSKYTIAFNNIKIFDDKDDLQDYIELSMFLSNVLFQKNRYNDTIDTLNRVLPIIDSEMIRLSAYELKDKYYTIFFLKGQASYRLKDYETATSIFKELTIYDPKDENYKNWLKNSLIRKKDRLLLVIYIVCSSAVLLEILLRLFDITTSRFRSVLLILSIIGFISAFTYNYFIEKSLRKSK